MTKNNKFQIGSPENRIGIFMDRHQLLPLLTILLLSPVYACYSQEAKILSNDGAWCWFSDPRAIYTSDKKDQIVTGWITSKGTVEAASLDPVSGIIKKRTLYERLEVDDHDNPAFVQLPDHRILAMYTWHAGKNSVQGVIQNTTKIPADVTSFEKAVVFRPRTDALVKKYTRETYSYANPFLLTKEKNTLYCFGRWIGYKPNMVTSKDNGKSWSEPKVVITSKELNTNNRPYVKYFSDGKSRIHMIFTDGHPTVEPLNSVYYCYYENQAFWRVDGTKICTVDQLPFHPSDASVVYAASASTGKAWIFDICTDRSGKPIVLYSRYPTDQKHQYYYARYDGSQWTDQKIVDAGGWFPQTPAGQKEREVNYSGGLTIDPADPKTVYFSHEVNDVFEISRGYTSDHGKSWQITPVTQHSRYDNVRPFIPRNKKPGQKTVLLWMQNRSYIHYTDYDSAILYKVLGK